jgi:hypothetical protein
METLSDRAPATGIYAVGTGGRITWHSAFYEALQMELRDYRDDLDFRLYKAGTPGS